MPVRMVRSKASGSWVLALLVVVVTAAGACFEIDGFECGSDQGCTRDGTAGRCEAEGVCAYPSEACPSQWRYSPNAGALADACVPQRAGGETETETGTGSSSSGLPMSTGSSSTGTGSVTTEGSAEPSCPGCQAVVVEGRTLFVCAAPATWFDARDACSDCGVELASVRSDAENLALADRVPATVQLWLGLSDIEFEGDWRWEDDAALGFEAWAEDEPSVLAEDDCAVLVASGEWFAKRCELPNPYACAGP